MTAGRSRHECTECTRLQRPAVVHGLEIALVLTLAVGGCSEGADSAGERSNPGVDVSAVDISGVPVATVGAWPEVRKATDTEVLYSGDTVRAGSPVFRVADLLPRPGGGVYVANAGTHEILALGAEGGLRWTAGGAGEGPGEFLALAELQPWRGDTIVALDARRDAASFWTSSGEFVRISTAGRVVSDPVPPASGSGARLLLNVAGSPIGVLEDNRLVVRGPQRAFGQGAPGLRRVRTALTLVGPEDSVRVPVELPGPWVYELRSPDRLPAILAPMSGGTAVTVLPGGREIAWARADAFEVVVLDASGQAVWLYRVDERPRPVTSSLRSTYLKQWSPWFEVDEEIPFPSHVPAFDRVFVGTGGALWARRFHWGDKGEEWIRFVGRPSEVSAERFRFPSRIEVMGATSDAVYGVRRDDLNVEHVVRIRLPGR